MGGGAVAPSLPGYATGYGALFGISRTDGLRT